MKLNEKLVFTLCTKCAELNCILCHHSESERALKGIFTTIEVDMAIEKGYQLKEVYLVYNYTRQFNNCFESYINLFLKIKQEASGLPPNTINIDENIKLYHQRENITLDKEKIVKNNALRSITKLLLNSLWGKFAQRTNISQDQLVTTRHELNELMSDEAKEILNLQFIDDETIMVQWKWKKEVNGSEGNTSPAVAAFVTSHARLKMYELMDQIYSTGSYILLYTDTDSVIFVERDGEQEEEIKLGNYLGELTDEIEQPFECTEALFLGPKSYCLKLKNSYTGEEKCIIKMKGFSLKNEAKVTFENLDGIVKSVLKEEDEKSIQVPQTVFICKKKTK